jgi:hypothetical protein
MADDLPGVIVSVTPDVLVLWLPLPDARYPSVNHAGGDAHRGGRKTAQYKRLFALACDAGRRAIAAGWAPVTTSCTVEIVRICPDARIFDVHNLGQLEMNALTRAGVWADDALAGPVHMDRDTDPGGPDRIVMTIRRVSAHRVAGRRASGSARKRPRTALPPPVAGGRVAFVNGAPVDADAALAELRKRL